MSFGLAASTRPAAEQFVDRLAKQILACTINQTEASIRIEGEDRDFNPGHDRAEQRSCLEGSQPLHAQRLAELIDLEQDFAERVLGPRASGTDGVIALAQGREQVTHSLERTHSVFPGAGKETKGASPDDKGERPTNLGAEIAKPKKSQRNEDGRAGRA